jgi:flagellar basal-body rod protein FlgC
MGDIFGALSIAGSGMTAERLRMDVVAENIANADTTRGADGQPYRRKEIVLQQGGQSFDEVLGGVQVAAIADDPSAPRRVYDPGHPDADKQGFVTMPNVNPVTEMVDLITASRGYEANTQALTAAKSMFQKALGILN